MKHDINKEKKQKKKINKIINKNEQNYEGNVKIIEMQHDINIEKGNENKSLDEAINKREEEIKQLEEKIEKEGDSNNEHKDAINHLKTEIKQLEEAQTNLSSINRSLDYQNKKYEDGEQRSEEHTSELQSRGHLVCRLLLEKKKLI